jgi:hypothetical protein
MALITKIMTGFAERNHLLSRGQAGGRAGRTTYDRIEALQAAIGDANARDTPLYIAYIDLTSAFTRVERGLFYQTLDQLGYPSDIIDIIPGIYEGANMTVVTEVGNTERVDLKDGLHQGCPSSPLLFILSLEPLLRLLTDSGRNYKLREGETVDPSAFIDDFCFATGTLAAMKHQLELLTTWEEWSNNSLNIPKCAVAAKAPPLGGGKSKDPYWPAHDTSEGEALAVNIRGIPIPRLEKDEPYKYQRRT